MLRLISTGRSQHVRLCTSSPVRNFRVGSLTPEDRATRLRIITSSEKTSAESKLDTEKLREQVDNILAKKSLHSNKIFMRKITRFVFALRRFVFSHKRFDKDIAKFVSSSNDSRTLDKACFRFSVGNKHFNGARVELKKSKKEFEKVINNLSWSPSDDLPPFAQTIKDDALKSIADAGSLVRALLNNMEDLDSKLLVDDPSYQQAARALKVELDAFSICIELFNQNLNEFFSNCDFFTMASFEKNSDNFGNFLDSYENLLEGLEHLPASEKTFLALKKRRLELLDSDSKNTN